MGAEHVCVGEMGVSSLSTVVKHYASLSYHVETYSESCSYRIPEKPLEVS